MNVSEERTSADGHGGVDDVRESLRGFEALARERGAEMVADEAARALEPLERGELQVVVLGQFKRGKSSVINAVLGEPILPTGMVPVTSVASLIRYGPEPAAEAVLRDGRREPIEPNALPAYITESGNPENQKGVEHVEIAHPASILHDGLVLVDTPGVGSVHIDTTERALAFLPRVDAAIVVLSPDPPISQAELDYIREIRRHTPHLFFLLNKVDLFAPDAWHEALRYDRRILAETLDRPEAEIEIHAVSATGPKGPGRPTPGPATEADGAVEPDGIASVGRALRELVEDRGSALIREAAARRLRRLADHFLGLLDLEASALRSPLEELEERLERMRARAAELRERRHEIRPGLESAKRRLAEEAETSLRAAAAEAAPDIAAELDRLIGESGESNAALAERVNRFLAKRIQETFDAWQAREGGRVGDAFVESMRRAASTVDASVDELREWIGREFGVQVPPPPEAEGLIDSTDFYYRIDAALPRLTVDVVRMGLLPRSLFRRRLRRRAERMAAGELELNAGRVRAELAYRLQETGRRFAARLAEHADEAERALSISLERALERRRQGSAQAGETLQEIERVRREVSALAAPRADDDRVAAAPG